MFFFPPAEIRDIGVNVDGLLKFTDPRRISSNGIVLRPAHTRLTSPQKFCSPPFLSPPPHVAHLPPSLIPQTLKEPIVPTPTNLPSAPPQEENPEDHVVHSLYELPLHTSFLTDSGCTIRREEYRIISVQFNRPSISTPTDLSACVPTTPTKVSHEVFLRIHSIQGERLIDWVSATRLFTTNSLTPKIPSNGDTINSVSPTAISSSSQTLHTPSLPQKCGSIFLTNYRLVFVPDTLPKAHNSPDIVNLPLSLISHATSLGGQPTSTMEMLFGAREGKEDDNVIDITVNPYLMDLRCSSVRFLINPPRCRELHNIIVKYSFPSPEDSFAFSFVQPPPKKQASLIQMLKLPKSWPVYCPTSKETRSWYVSNVTSECSRQRIPLVSPKQSKPKSLQKSSETVQDSNPSPQMTSETIYTEPQKAEVVTDEKLRRFWYISSINKDFAISSSYPRELVVPAMVDDNLLTQVAAFRSKGRIPVLCWRHSSGACITRGSQPLIGVFSQRSAEDEKLLEAVRLTNDPTKDLYILDSRPQANGYVNRALGGGYESSVNYNRAQLQFLGMPNIHAVRDSFTKLKDAILTVHSHPNYQHCNPTFTDGNQEENDSPRPLPCSTSVCWQSLLYSSGWLENIRSILAGVARIVQLIDVENICVFVHCSDAWDRTAQLTSLSMLCMDPFYRTLEGFLVLIEKEWLSMGHKFADRLHSGINGANSTEASPVFLQFLECTWQLSVQYPTALQFNESFLITIMKEATLCRYGTFLFNCDKERKAHNIDTRTPSLFTHLLSSSPLPFINPFYSENSVPVLYPKAETKDLQFWKGYFFRSFLPTPPPIYSVVPSAYISPLHFPLPTFRTKKKVEECSYPISKRKEEEKQVEIMTGSYGPSDIPSRKALEMQLRIFVLEEENRILQKRIAEQEQQHKQQQLQQQQQQQQQQEQQLGEFCSHCLMNFSRPLTENDTLGYTPSQSDLCYHPASILSTSPSSPQGIQSRICRASPGSSPPDGFTDLENSFTAGTLHSSIFKKGEFSRSHRRMGSGCLEDWVELF